MHFPVRSSELPGLDAVAGDRDYLTTEETARAINRAPQTLRQWASAENGPLRPIRINRRLAWRVSDVRALLLDGGRA